LLGKKGYVVVVVVDLDESAFVTHHF